MTREASFTIVGSGLAGALMACYLAKEGHSVELFEKRSDPREDIAEGGKSINLALSVRGIHALEEVGVVEAVLRDAIAMPGRMIHSPTGEQSFQPYGKDSSQAIHSVSRAGLNRTLIEAAASYPNVTIRFDHQCEDVSLKQRTVIFQDQPEVAYQHLIGADGAFSAVRARLQRRERFDYQQHYLKHGYKELVIPAGPNGEHLIEPHALHIWPRESFMLIALPNRDGSFTCTFFAPFEGEDSFASLRSEPEVRIFFESWFPDAVLLMPTLVEDYLTNPIGPLVTVRCAPWHVEDEVVLIGDACHAVVPFLGQGMNAAFEDCSVLAEELRGREDILAAFVAYEQRRREHANVLADLAIKNYHEMRDHVGSRGFRLKKRMEILLHKLLGNLYIPLYTLISFTRVPYGDALRRERKQKRWALIFGLLLLAILLWGCLQ